MSTFTRNLWIVNVVLGSFTIWWFYDENQKIENWKKETSQTAQQYNQQKENQGCIKQTKVGNGRYSPYEYQIWKCPNDANEYLVR